MPVYDYQCPNCGPFTAFRSMADYAKPTACEYCGVDAPRAVGGAPALAIMDSELRAGLAINERSRHEPRRSGGRHPSGCGCCGAPKGKLSSPPGMAKTFPGSRPWMISH